jgi:serine/threonine-protein kinase
VTLQAGTPIGKYVVRRKIAEGGMAEIYLCSSRGPEGFEKEVVIKRIRSFLAGDQTFVQMFIAEARLVSRLNHANLVQIFDFDKHEDTYYLAMEYVRGHSLWDVRRRSRELMEPMPTTLVAQVGAEVARGLAHAHKASDKGKPLNLVHRDVTPHNVLLSFEGAVKLTDFGVAKHSASHTSAGVLKGKFAYMSPEQSRGEPVDARTDLFALGIVLWEMLTGGRLFDGDSDVAVLRAVQSSAIAPPARLNPDVPEALSAIVMRALERDPAARFQSAQEMERALAGFVLSHARTVDDTDLAGYLRKLYADELAAEAARDGSRAGTSSGASGPAPAPAEAAGQGERTPADRPPEPTAVMRKPVDVRGPGPTPLSPDEDMRAATYVVDRPQPPGTEVKPPATAAPASPPSVVVEEPLAAPRATPPPPAVRETMSIPAQRAGRPGTVGMRRGLMAGGAAAVAIAGIAVAVAVTRPAPAAAPDTSDRPEAPAKAAEAPPPPVQPPAPAPEPAVASAAPAPAQPEEQGTGTLVVKVTPYATVYIDGRYRKEVQGRASFKLRAGEHKVRLTHPRGSKEVLVQIVAGQDHPVEHNFFTQR